MGNINLYKSSSASGPWSLVKENIQSPVTFDEAASGLIYYAVRDEGNGSDTEASEYKVISEPVYVFGSTDKVSNITFDDATDLDSLIVKVTSACEDASNHKVQVQVNVKDTGWKDLAQVEIGSDIQATYTPTEEDGITEGSQIKFRAYIFNTTNANYRTNYSEEYVYTLNIDTNIDVQFDNMDADYYYLRSTGANISNVDTIDGIEFIAIQDNIIRLKDINYLSTQISKLNIDWSFDITINLSKIGALVSILKSITIPNNLFSITMKGDIITNYNMIINNTPQNKGYTFSYSSNIATFRLAGSTVDNRLVYNSADDYCSGDGNIIQMVRIDKKRVIYYATLGENHTTCIDGYTYCIEAISLGAAYAKIVYDELSVSPDSPYTTFFSRIGISNGGDVYKEYGGIVYAMC